MTRPAGFAHNAGRPSEGTAQHLRSSRGQRPARQGGSLRGGPATKLIGAMALAFSALYFLSDVIEVTQGGFSAGQLWLTLIVEAAVPIFVVGLAVLQRPRFGRLGMLSALAYAYSYVIFSGTVVFALVNSTKDYQTLSDELGAVMMVHGAVMLIAGLGFGYAVLRARLLPSWTAVALMAGVILVALAQGLPEGFQLVAAGLRAFAFAGMGAALLRARGPREPSNARRPVMSRPRLN